MRVLFVHFEKVFGAQFLVADVTRDSAKSGRAFDVYSMHLQHVCTHKVLVAELLVANRAVAATQ